MNSSVPSNAAVPASLPAAPAAPLPARSPLGLPAGSIRALLTGLIVGFIVAQTARGEEIGLLWSETLMIALAHYYTTRRFVPLSPETLERLAAEGLVETETRPLYLPRHTVRGAIVLAFLGLAVYLFREGRLLEPQAVAVLGTVGAYFLGLLFKAVLDWWARRNQRPTAWWWADVKALVTLTVVIAAIALHLTGAGAWLPFPLAKLEGATLGLVLFYFGSR